MCVDKMLLELVDNGLLRPEKINVTVPVSNHKHYVYMGNNL